MEFGNQKSEKCINAENVSRVASGEIEIRGADLREREMRHLRYIISVPDK